MRFQERYHGTQRRAWIFCLSILTVDLNWLDGEVFQSLETEKTDGNFWDSHVWWRWGKKRIKLTNMSAHAAYVVPQTS